MGVEVYVSDEAVDVRFDGLDILLCLSTGVILPMDQVVGARVVPIGEAKADLGCRVAGAYLPHAFANGHFTYAGRPGAWQLWDTYRDDEVLVIDTRLQRPARVVLQHPGRHDIAWYIGERVAA